MANWRHCSMLRWLHIHTLWPGHRKNREINRGRSMHGCKWQMGNEFHSAWEALLTPLRNHDSVFSSPLSSPWISTTDCNSCLCPWPWQRASSRAHFRMLQQCRLQGNWPACIFAWRFQQLWRHRTSPKLDTFGQDARFMSRKHSWCICIKALPCPWVVRS